MSIVTQFVDQLTHEQTRKCFIDAMDCLDTTEVIQLIIEAFEEDDVEELKASIEASIKARGE